MKHSRTPLHIQVFVSWTRRIAKESSCWTALESKLVLFCFVPLWQLYKCCSSAYLQDPLHSARWEVTRENTSPVAAWWPCCFRPKILHCTRRRGTETDIHFAVSPLAEAICSRYAPGIVWLLDSTYKTVLFVGPVIPRTCLTDQYLALMRALDMLSR